MEKGYEEAVYLTVKKLKESNPSEIVERCGAEWVAEEGIIKIKYLNKTYLIKYPEIKILNGDALTEKEKILILHYLSSSPDLSYEKTEQKYISFKEIKTGNIYFPSFENRVIKPLVLMYGERPELFIKKSIDTGGERTDFSDYSVIFRVFPRVEVIFILYPADEEFPAGVSVLFNPSITDYLDIEDTAILSEEIVNKIIQ